MDLEELIGAVESDVGGDEEYNRVTFGWAALTNWVSGLPLSDRDKEYLTMSFVNQELEGSDWAKELPDMLEALREFIAAGGVDTAEERQARKTRGWLKP